MKGKLSFASGMALGLLVGSRIGPGLYERVASAASTVAADPRVRKGASTAGDHAAQAAKSAGESAAHQVKHAGDAVAHRFGGRFGERWNAITHTHAHSATNGSPSGEVSTGRFDDEPLGE